jgi:type IV pilus assembly protein PilA
MKSKKGFTFIELIIVMAIIAIFAALLIPTWGYFLSRARTRQNNATARIVFNAAQTAVVEMNANERSLHVDPANRYVTSPFYFYWNGSSGFVCDSDGNDISAAGETRNAVFADTVNRILDNTEYAYKIYVVDNKVEAAAAGRDATDNFVGVYPVNLKDAEENGTLLAGEEKTIRNNHVVHVPLERLTV